MGSVSDVWVTIVCAGCTTVMVVAVIAFSHQKLTATLSATWNGKQASVVITSPGTTIAPASGGGAYGPLSWMPHWKQTGGVLPDGQTDPQQYNDCGETCVAMVVAAVRGVAVSPGDIRQQLGGVKRSGLTTASDLVQALHLNHVRAHVETADAANAWMTLAGCYAVAKPAIVLGYWLSMACMHWMLLADKSPGVFVFVDPWTGEEISVALPQWNSRYCQSTVIVDDHLAYDAHNEPTPGTGAEA